VLGERIESPFFDGFWYRNAGIDLICIILSRTPW